jgi:transcriptional regulator GlxA family with amidase domain
VFDGEYDRMRASAKTDSNQAGTVNGRSIAILGISPVRALDLIGPGEVFMEANRVKGSTFYRLTFLSGAKDTAILSPLALPFIAGSSYLDVDSTFDTLLVAGGGGAQGPRYDATLLSWLQRQAPACRRFGSVCTGAMALAAAGLLDGKRATTHWNWCDELAQRYPRVTIERDPIFIKDGNCYTSAGVTAGIDLALALVEEDLGREVALRAAQMMVVFLRRPGGQSQFSATLTAQKAERNALADLLAWLPEHLISDLSIKAMARIVAMSPRNFSRAFKQAVGSTPAQHLETLRVEAARRLLETSSLSQAEIAGLVGLNNTETLRRIFGRHLHVTLGAYRKSFGK